MFDQILLATATTVNNNTPEYINEEIQKRIAANISKYQERNEEEIKKRIEELEAEWDTERVLETNLSAIVLLSSILGITRSKAWMLVSGTASVFMIQHGLEGWCPPLSFIRRFGVRTADEINQEKTALEKMITAQ